MKLIYYSFLLLAAFYAPLVAQETPLFPKGEKAPNVHHTGDVWLYHVSDADAPFDYNLTLATFAPGAKLDWHLHPAGQQLLITDGIGYYQERDKLVQVVQKGDVIKCLPGVEHWHAATPDSDFAYLAITGNQPTQWLEKLTDEAYNSIKTDGMNNSAVGKEIIELSKEKWQWMAKKKWISLLIFSMKMPSSFTWEEVGEKKKNSRSSRAEAFTTSRRTSMKYR